MSADIFAIENPHFLIQLLLNYLIMTYTARFQENAFNLLCTFFQIKTLQYAYSNDLEYETDQQEFVNRLSCRLNNQIEFVSNHFLNFIDQILYFFETIFITEYDSSMEFSLNYITENESSESSVRNYGGFYTDRRISYRSDNQRYNDFKSWFSKLISFFGKEKETIVTKEEKQIHRAGKMYRGHSLD